MANSQPTPITPEELRDYAKQDFSTMRETMKAAMLRSGSTNGEYVRCLLVGDLQGRRTLVTLQMRYELEFVSREAQPYVRVVRARFSKCRFQYSVDGSAFTSERKVLARIYGPL